MVRVFMWGGGRERRQSIHLFCLEYLSATLANPRVFRAPLGAFPLRRDRTGPLRER